MKVHIRSPTQKEVRKSEQCRHTFRITVAKCAPCDGYNLNCEHYEKTDKDAADTVARTLTARADGSPMIDRGPNIVTQKGK